MAGGEGGQSQDLKQGGLVSEPLPHNHWTRSLKSSRDGSLRAPRYSCACRQSSPDFPFVTANEFPFTLNPLEMDYELRVLTLAKERIMALPSLAGRNQLSGLCD